MKRILIVDDEPNIRRILQVAFDKAGYQATVAEDGHSALAELDRNPFDCLLTDVTMPGMSGYELSRRVIAMWPEMPVIVMTAFGTIPQAIQAIRDGAFEFVTKPFELDSLKKIVASSLSGGKAQSKREKAARQPKTSLIAESQQMKEILATIEQVADSKATVLISGESGTGKEVVAKLLHEMSPRSTRPFVAVSCAALPDTLLESELFGYEKGAFTGANGAKAGRFELAHEGTLFLDEIGDLPAQTQVKLLRVLQEREFERLGATKATRVDVRLITATNRNLHEAIAQERFRLDLLYRLQVIELHLPSLRERTEDIVPLANYFLAKYGVENGRALRTVSASAESTLRSYEWPGNVRELENAIERATVIAKPDETALELWHLPKSLLKAA